MFEVYRTRLIRGFPLMERVPSHQEAIEHIGENLGAMISSMLSDHAGNIVGDELNMSIKISDILVSEFMEFRIRIDLECPSGEPVAQ